MKFDYYNLKSTITLSFLFCFSFLVSCASLSKKQEVAKVSTVSAMHDMMMSGDTSGKLNLNNIKSKNLYGIGPLENLKGEITIVDGVPYVGTVSSKGLPVIEKNWDKSAIFFVHADTRAWKTFKYNKPLNSKAELNQLLANTFKELSVDLEEKVLFKVRANATSLKYHIMNLKDGEMISRGSHKSAKKVYTIKNSPVEIIGFWAPKKMMGVYSHKGDRTHLHFISADEKHSGHIDDLNLGSGFEVSIAINTQE